MAVDQDATSIGVGCAAETKCARCRKALPELGAFCSRCGAVRHDAAGAVERGSHWKFRSLASVGFRVGVWPWIVSLAGGGFIVFCLAPRLADLDTASRPPVPRLAETLVSVSLMCFVAGLILAYLLWRVGGRTRGAAGIGWAVGMLLFVGIDAMAVRLQQADRRDRLARAERQRTETTIENWQRILEQQGGDSYDAVGPQPSAGR